MRIFRYHPEVDAFELTEEYAALAEALEFGGWESFAWIGRLFTLDNDVGEHWFDNWELREQRAEVAARHGLDADALLIIDPRLMADGRDGPCNTDDFRARFWTEVLSSLDLSEELIIAKAREFHCRYSAPSVVTGLEARIAAWRQDRGAAATLPTPPSPLASQQHQSAPRLPSPPPDCDAGSSRPPPPPPTPPPADNSPAR